MAELGEVRDRRSHTAVVRRPNDGYALRGDSASHDDERSMPGQRRELASRERRAQEDEGLTPLVDQAQRRLLLVPKPR